jgi:hypothetical protein
MGESKKNAVSESRKPFLQFCVLCDGVAPMPNGKVAFVGVFSIFNRPVVVPQFTIATCWTDGVGEFTQRLRILNPQLEQVIEVNDQKFTLKNRVTPATHMTHLGGVDMSKAGVYWIEVYLGDERVMSIPIPVQENILGRR